MGGRSRTQRWPRCARPPKRVRNGRRVGDGGCSVWNGGLCWGDDEGHSGGPAARGHRSESFIAHHLQAGRSQRLGHLAVRGERGLALQTAVLVLHFAQETAVTKSRSRRPKAPPYLRHKRSGRAYTYVRDGGKRRCIYLVEWDSPASHREYRRVLADHLAGVRVTTPTEAKLPPQPAITPPSGNS